MMDDQILQLLRVRKLPHQRVGFTGFVVVFQGRILRFVEASWNWSVREIDADRLSSAAQSFDLLDSSRFCLTGGRTDSGTKHGDSKIKSVGHLLVHNSLWSSTGGRMSVRFP